MSKRLAFIDLDGTLLGSDKTVSAANRAALDRLRARTCKSSLPPAGTIAISPHSPASANRDGSARRKAPSCAMNRRARPCSSSPCRAAA
jgi:hypothetical protein